MITDVIDRLEIKFHKLYLTFMLFIYRKSCVNPSTKMYRFPVAYVDSY